MKAVELRQLKEDELESRVGSLRDALFKLKLTYATGQVENVSSVRIARRDLARALTVRAERRQSK